MGIAKVFLVVAPIFFLGGGKNNEIIITQVFLFILHTNSIWFFHVTWKYKFRHTDFNQRFICFPTYLYVNYINIVLNFWSNLIIVDDNDKNHSFGQNTYKNKKKSFLRGAIPRHRFKKTWMNKIYTSNPFGAYQTDKQTNTQTNKQSINCWHYF